jgi:TolB-like protein/DNA-binding winged helix-turn-helix (wHTH) protein/tetratricopeptide (TPR) repeat protein
MATTPTAAGTGEKLRFGDFELDLGAYELRHAGKPIRLERQPMDLLVLLVERRGQLVTRAEIIDKLWGKDVFVDVETGVHTAARKIRQALGDAADAPKFVETVPGKGYRFVAPVTTGEAPPQPVRPMNWRPIAAAAALAALTGVLVWASLPSRAPAGHVVLAVLPFENLTGDADREYVADGLTEEMIASLGQVDPDRLSVIGRTSSMTYKGTRKSLAQIGEELGVDYLVESSLRAESNRLRITSTLVRVRDQVQVWSASYDREPTSTLGLQQELSAAIAEQIRLNLSPERRRFLERRHTTNPAAYDLYLRGQFFGNQLTPATNTRAIESFQRAIEIDPRYALAWSGLANIYEASPINSDTAPLEIRDRAVEAARRAVEAEPDLAEAQEALGNTHFHLTWDWGAAEAAYRRAIALDPSYARAHRNLGHVLSQTGRHAEAQRAMRRVRELDPLYAMSYAVSSQIAFQARTYPAAAEHARQAIVIDPDFWIGHVMSGQAYEQLGRIEQALDAFATAERLSAGNSKTVSFRAHALATAGRTDEARAVLAQLVARARERYVPPYAIALVYAGLSERGAAFEWLDRALVARDVHLIFLTADPKWDPYRSDPRFSALLKRCGFIDASIRTSR